MSDKHPTDSFVMEAGGPQPYHLVKPSPWPLLSSLAAGFLAFGLIRYLHYDGGLTLVLGLLAVTACMAGWWRDVIIESVIEKAHSKITKLGMRYGMMLFIASEVMFFAAFFWAFFDAWLYPKAGIDHQWPPEQIEVVDPFGLPLLMTLILLLSGCTVTWAHHAILEGRNKAASTALGLTIMLGIFFTAVQIYEYTHVHFGVSDTVYGATFYLATGFHGLHVIIGTIFLGVCWWRVNQPGHFTPQSHFGFEAAAWYWHFVDVVWLFLFFYIYWFSSLGSPNAL